MTERTMERFWSGFDAVGRFIFVVIPAIIMTAFQVLTNIVPITKKILEEYKRENPESK